MGAAAKIVEDHGGIVAGTGSDSLILVDLIHEADNSVRSINIHHIQYPSPL